MRHSDVPYFLKQNRSRRYLVKNHSYLETHVTWIYSQGFLKQGLRHKAERLLLEVLALLKYIAGPALLLSMANWVFSTPVEISPIRMGKKVKMIPRMSSFSRQYTRGAFVLTKQLQTRKFLGRPFKRKVLKEVVSGLFFPEESFRYTQHALIYLAGFFNLRYLGKRWF